MSSLGRILIADDEATFLESTADLLRREGFECDCASDAAVAADLLRRGGHDLLIADIRMPGNLELQLVRELPGIVEGLPVVLVTGYPTLASAIDSIELPVVAYLLKPIDFPQLVAKVQSAIPRFRMFRTVRNLRKDLLECGDKLAGVEEQLGRPPEAQSPGPVHDFLALAFEGIARSLLDVRRLSESLALQSPAEVPCAVMNCPRGRQLADAVRDCIRTLEKTKKAFKSKELADLREKLEVLLRELGELA